MDLAPVQQIALFKSFEKLVKGPPLVAVEAGTYSIDVWVELALRGGVTRKPDVEYTPTVKIPLYSTLGFLLDELGIKGEKARAVLAKCMSKSLKHGADAGRLIRERIEDLQFAEAQVQKLTGALPKEIRAGATTAELVLDIIGFRSPALNGPDNRPARRRKAG